MSFAGQSGSSFTKPLRAADCGGRTSRAFPFAGSRQCRAGMTLEAAMVIPLFLFFMLNVLGLFEAVRLQSCLQTVLQQCGEELCEKAYYTVYTPQSLFSSGGSGEGIPEGGAGAQIFTAAYVQARVNRALGEDYVRRHCVGGSVYCLGSRALDENGDILLIAEYRLRPFIPVLALPGFSMQSCFFGHAWVGYRGGGGAGDGGVSSGDAQEVYVTKYGEVYHEDRDCIYLNPQVRSVPAQSLDTLRSADGSIYHPCELCHPGNSGMVLVTKEGNRYHCDPSCGGIGRTISEMDPESAQTHYRPCPKCAGGAAGGSHVH